MKKLLIFILSFCLFTPSLFAVSSSDVNYKISDYIVDSQIDAAGNLKVKEIIKVEGTFNGYIRDLVYKNSRLSEFTGSDSDFEGSAIYNATNVELYKVGKISWDGELNYDAFESEIEEFSECSNSANCYEKSDITDGISLKMYNETRKGSTYFYIEYLLGNVVVQHNDINEIYYSFIGNSFDDDIKKYQLRVLLASPTNEQIRVWAHGPLEGDVYVLVDGDPEKYYGGYLTIENLKANTPVDMRMTFPKNLIFVYVEGISKMTNVDGLDKILKVEEKRAIDANNLRNKARVRVYGTYILSGLYLLITSILIIYIYIKYDKEYKSEFDNEYNREFIDDYDVTVIEYLMNKNITSNGFSTSILNLIYKKKIKVEEILDKKNKKDYIFTKVSDEDILPSEKKVMDILFNEAGDKNSVTLSDIKKYASKIEGTTSKFLSSYDEWKYTVKDEAIKENFYENHTKIKLYFSLYCLIGLFILYLHISVSMFNILTLLVLLFTIFFFIYIITYTKRSKKGSLHYAKWKAFKKFLNDFGRFDEKELPEIALWERYLVYANIFGIADKVGKTMKLKFNELGYDNTLDVRFDYMLWSNLNTSVNKTVNSSISTAHSKVSEAVAMSHDSSGGGFGGGFSSGGGFGGGGGGGRGF